MARPFLALIILGAAAACTNAGSYHAAQSANHSEASAMHGSAAAGDSVATVVAVPLIVSGSALLVSGAAIQSSMTSPAPPPTRTPNGPPAL